VAAADSSALTPDGHLPLALTRDDEDRLRQLDLAEALHPGMSEVAVYRIWLQRSPIEPSRFFAQLEQERIHATGR
jgi:hypothetical protein